MTNLRASCGKTIGSLEGELLCFTGKVLVDGEWVIRERCARMAELRGSAGWKSDYSRKITLVVYGDLASQHVTDERRQYSQKLVHAADDRLRGWHVCVVDADGFSQLLKGRPAPCRDLRAVSRIDPRITVV